MRDLVARFRPFFVRPSRHAAKRQRIAAPIGGEVVGLRVFGAGAVVGPRDVLMEIVPDEKRLMQGSVSYVSGDRLVDSQNGAAFYVVHIDVPSERLAQDGLRLQAGMPAEIFIRTDERTTFDYLLAPVTSYLRRAMREPL